MNSITICGCVYNCAPYLRKVFENIRKIGDLFDTYSIVIAIDISEDDSYNILLDIQKEIPMEIIVNKNPRSKTSRCENIANARNSILDFIRKSQKEQYYDYFAMMDMDDVNAGTIHTPVLQKYILNSSKWDSISFNRRFYYDIWALSVQPFIISCWHWSNDSIQFENPEVVQIMHNYISNRLASTTQLVDVFSAFNGFAVYKTGIFLSGSYESDIRKNLDILPRPLIEENIHFLGKSIFLNFTEDCEHRYFHLKAKFGGASIKIAPDILFEEYNSPT